MRLPTQLDLPIAEDSRQDPVVASSRDPMSAEELRRRLPPAVHFGTAGWVYPGWSGLVWRGGRTAAELERTGLQEYAAHPLFTTMHLEASEDAAASERDLRRYAGQLPDWIHCVLQVHADVTTPRFSHTDPRALAEGKAGRVNPRFLDARFFVQEILQTYTAVFGPRLGPFLFTFPPGLRRAGIDAATFAHRLDAFVAALPGDLAVAIELRDPELLSLPYARLLARHDVTHVFTTWAGMPSFAEQARAVPTSPEYVIRLADPTGRGAARSRELAPFDRLRNPRPELREQVVELLCKTRGVPAYVLVHNEAEGSAPLTVRALAELLVARLGD